MAIELALSELKTKTKVCVEAHARLHMALIDLNGSLGRIDGGFGMALQDPSIRLEMEESDETKLEPYTKALEKAISRARKVFNYDKDVLASLIDDYPEHIGLGHTTQLTLAVGTAVCKLKGIDMSVSELARRLGRGGTSGIGVSVFEKGGFVIDVGHSFGPDKAKDDFYPSSYSKASPPPVMWRWIFPEDWRIVLVKPRVSRKLFGKTELNIFQQYCPIPANDVEKISRIVLFQVIPSLIERDLATFGEALNAIKKIGFKKVEISLQHPIVKDMIQVIEANGISAVGLSSMGPTVFAICSKEEDPFELISSLEKLEEKYSLKCDIVQTRGYNQCASVETYT